MKPLILCKNNKIRCRVRFESIFVIKQNIISHHKFLPGIFLLKTNKFKESYRENLTGISLSLSHCYIITFLKRSSCRIRCFLISVCSCASYFGLNSPCALSTMITLIPLIGRAVMYFKIFIFPGYTNSQRFEFVILCLAPSVRN